MNQILEKAKQFLSNAWAVIVLVLGGILGLLLYFLKAKQREINALQAKIDLTETQKQADLLEVDIKQRLENKNLLQKEIDELNNSLVLLSEKRKQIAEQEKNRPASEVEDFWNKK